ncbi:hypothetical protein LJC09_04190 [Desulfovibrio sp. OttesenSCG-928-F20]|nr:hypothetical protein [Desulfovibrio sp. OttesenSCG-928-F20]
MEKNRQSTSPNVRQALLPLFKLCAAALLLVAGLALFVQYIRNYEREINAHHQSAVRLYRQSIRDCHAALGMALRLIIENESVRAPLANRDGAALIKLYGNVFEQLKKRYSLNHLVFCRHARQGGDPYSQSGRIRRHASPTRICPGFKRRQPCVRP